MIANTPTITDEMEYPFYSVLLSLTPTPSGPDQMELRLVPVAFGEADGMYVQPDRSDLIFNSGDRDMAELIEKITAAVHDFLVFNNP